MSKSTARSQDGRGHLIRAAHAAVRAAGLDEDARHDFQMRVTGKASMRDMSVAELRHLRNELNRITGFGQDGRAGKGRRGGKPAVGKQSDAVPGTAGEPAVGKAAADRKADYHPRAPLGGLRYIHALWGELGQRGVLKRPDRAGLNAFIRSRFEGHWSYVPIDVDALDDRAHITDVIQALKAMLGRAQKGQTP